MVAEEYGFPPIYKFVIERLLPRKKMKILDLGCGSGVAGALLNRYGLYEYTGVDVYQPYLSFVKKKGNYKTLIKKDITKINFPNKSFEVTLLLQVIEHLEKKDAKRLIKKIEKITKEKIIITVPQGDCDQEEYDDNIYHTHKSTWTPNELRKLGFNVYGLGLKAIYGDKSYGGGVEANWWQKIVVPISIVIAPLIFFKPEWSAQLVAVKYLEKQ